MGNNDNEWILAILILLSVWLLQIFVICTIGVGTPSAM